MILNQTDTLDYVYQGSPDRMPNLTPNQYYLCLPEKLILNQTNLGSPLIRSFPPMTEMKIIPLRCALSTICHSINFLYITSKQALGITFIRDSPPILKYKSTYKINNTEPI